MGRAVSDNRATGSDSRVTGGAGSDASIATGIRTEVDDRGIARVTIDRPERMNALNGDASSALIDFLTIRCAADDIRAVIIDGAGGHFSTGADIRDIAARASENGGIDERSAASVIGGGSALARAVRSVEVPVVASVDGAAVGIGASLAFASDLTFATRRSYFLLAFTNIGLMPDGGATATVSAAIGRARANRLVLLGEKLPAPEAFDAGLISGLVDDRTALDAEIAGVAKRFAQSSTQALRLAKAALDANTLAGFEATLTRETDGQTRLLQSDEFQAAIAAFSTTRRH